LVIEIMKFKPPKEIQMADQPQDSPELPEQKAIDGRSSKPEPSPEDLLRARRRKLLKGLATGVPAIITLQSGAALAASTSNSDCVVNGGGANLTAVGGGVAVSRCVAPIAGNLNWQYETSGGASFTAGFPGGGGESCLVYMTPAGNKQGGTPWGGLNNGGGNVNTTAGPNTGATYYAVRASCWASFY
jgi:hypothetical protein